ncbi:MAG: HD domain-containing phosphohydrolase, partial [Bdellovibrionota bacterium]
MADSSPKKDGSFVTVAVKPIPVGEPLPVNIYVYLEFRFIVYRAAGDALDRNAYDRLEFKKVQYLFVRDSEKAAFEEWISKFQAGSAPGAVPAELADFAASKEDLHRKTLDIFQARHPDRKIAQVLDASKRVVDEMMKVPYAVKTLAQLQSYSQGTVSHSINVSMLSVYLAFQMGYDSKPILNNIGTGALIHDIGKVFVKVNEKDTPDIVALKMMDHPKLGEEFVSKIPNLPNEVRLIVAQHHECQDGTGYPKRLRGAAMYDLAKIVAIANTFDEIVGGEQGPLVERQKKAITQLDQVLFRKFDPVKLEKALKILK